MNRISRFVIPLFSIIILSGCLNKTIIDNVSLIEGLGFDHSGEGEYIIGTVLYPLYLPDQPPKNKTFTAKGRMKNTILPEIQRQSPTPVVTGSLEIVLFGKELAEKEGVLDLIDPIQRDPRTGSGIFLAIVDGEAKELLEGEYGIRGNAGQISSLFETNFNNEDLPKTNLQIFLTTYYTDGRTPFMPMLKQISKEKVELTGLAFLRYGKMVESIKAEEMFFFKLLVDKYSQGLHLVQVGEDEAAIRNIHSRHKYHLNKKSPYEMTIDITVDGVINDFSGNRLNQKTIEKVEKSFEEEIRKESLKLVELFKEKKIDPIGLGHFIKTRDRDFDLDKWNESQYQELTVHINPKVRIVEAGVIE